MCLSDIVYCVCIVYAYSIMYYSVYNDIREEK